jgi:hypothetical protein
MNRIKVAVGGLAVAMMVGAMLPVSSAFASHRHKVDCAKVMEELNSGKKVKEVAKDLHISRSSVRRCAKKAKAEESKMGKPEEGKMAKPEAGTMAKPEAGTMAKPEESPGSMASPAAK